MQSQTLQEAYELLQQDRLIQAEASLLGADSEHASDPGYWFLLAVTRHRLGRLDEALESIEQSLALEPAGIQVLSARAQILFDMGRRPEALETYAGALESRPDEPRLLTNMAIVYEALEQPEEALAAYTRALAAAPAFRDARLNRAVLNTRLQQMPRALADYDQLALQFPDDRQILTNRADLLLAMGRLSEALVAIEQAQKLGPPDTRARFTHCVILAALGRQQEAQTEYDNLLATDRDGVGRCFRRIGMALQPDQLDFRLIWFWAAARRQQICNWNDLDSLVAELKRFAESDSMPAVNLMDLLFATLGLPVHPQTRLGIARRIAQRIEAGSVTRLTAADLPVRDDQRLHVAYFGANFRDHPNAYLTRRLFELHDRSRFVISVYSLTKADGSEVLNDIIANCDAFVELIDVPSDEAAQRISRDGVQILIDVGMYNDGGRPEILAYRPAPVIASYLGTELTSGANFVDYRISDRQLMQTDRQNWVEKVVTLPGCCYPYNDAERIDDGNRSRTAAGLPENGFVFCSFNNNFKIEPVVFGLWCNILQRVPGSVLWILVNGPAVQNNLLREAEIRGVDSSRLVFCEREPHARHLGRHRLADLFLDTLWCNAHTSAVESLWAGLPLLTCAGQISASRVGASVLSAAGLPELVTHSLDRYEALAVELATVPDKLAAIREKLARNRRSCSLFDSLGSTRKLETAYEKMWQRLHQGLAPADIDIS